MYRTIPFAVGANFATPYEHGSHKGQNQIQQVEYKSLDVILSVGYRVKSSRGVEFRRWANRILKEFVLRSKNGAEIRWCFSAIH